MDHSAIIHHSVQLLLQFLFLLGPALAGKLPTASLLSCLAFQDIPTGCGHDGPPCTAQQCHIPYDDLSGYLQPSGQLYASHWCGFISQDFG